MFRARTKRVLLGVVAVAAVMMTVSTSEACHRWRGGWGCGWGGWGCGYAPRYVSVCYTPCVVNCCAPVCCDVGPACCGDAAPVAAGPAIEPTAGAMQPTPAPPPPAPPREPATPAPALPKPTTALPSDAGMLSVIVPEDATVFINGLETKSVGARRQYLSHGLKAGLSYNYQIRVVATRNGKPVEENRTVTLTGGQTQSVALLDSRRESGLALNW